MPSDAFDDFTDLDGYLRIPRVSGLAVSDDASRVVLSVTEPDAHLKQNVPGLWEIDAVDPTVAPRRLTRSSKGESAPRFTADGTLLFTSSRPDRVESDQPADSALWRLPERGEASVLATAPGGLTVAGVADDGTVLARTAVLVGGSLTGDSDARKRRKDRGLDTILHTGMPIRFWDNEVGDTSPRLVLVEPDAGAGKAFAGVRDLTPGADTVALANGSADLSADGRTAVTTWRRRIKGGEVADAVLVLDLSGSRPRRRTLLRGTRPGGYGGLVLSPDAASVALTRSTESNQEHTSYSFLEIHRLDGAGEPVVADVGDLTVGGYAWAPDGSALYVTGDLHSRGAILQIDPVTGALARTLADDAAYSSVQVRHHALFALRSTIAEPPRPVRFDLRSGERTDLATRGVIGRLPGHLEWVSTAIPAEHDGEPAVDVGGWLLTPRGASRAEPAPVMVWIHGGPHASYNAWSWRWCPWLAVARGYAVLMPDPAMSTGYGHAGLNRAWPRRAARVWHEVQTLADVVLRRTTLDSDRTALLGASFGGFMTNWIAGQTDRFRAIVTHAGLYALDQQHATTDAAASKTRQHGRVADSPDWYAENSPHHRVQAWRTPMLVTHGNRDYRVPLSEALRLWWDLVSRWPGSPSAMPHRFLQLTQQNHWVLSPASSRVWNQSVLDFCDLHVRGAGDGLDELADWEDEPAS